MVKNGYFIFSAKEDGTYITIMPPQNGGKAVSADNIISYLESIKFNDFDSLDIVAATKAGDNVQHKISDITMKSCNSICIYDIDAVKMSMTAIMYPPVGDGGYMTVTEVEGDLQAKGVKYGIDKAVIEEYVNNRVYNTTFEVARGTEPVQGTDAKIEYLFNTQHIGNPRVNDDGTVDYHELDLISKVVEGQPVAKIIPENKGTPGRNIMGEEIAPARVSKKNFKYSKNVHISEDGLLLISDVNGHATLENDKVFVSNTYDVPVDVDNTTGDIDYDGNVIVRGNVRAGFSLKATGDITIMGVVEGAYVEAGGNLTINCGIQGMNKAEIRSGGNLVTKFIENATVVCGGSIETDTMLHSSTFASDIINVSGKNGLLVGGTARSTKCVTAKVIGNEMGTDTNVYVGVDPILRKKVRTLAENIKKYTEDKEKLNQIVSVLRKKMELEGSLDDAKKEMLQKSTKNLILLEQSIKQCTEEYKKGQEELVEGDDARVKIKGTIYPGVKLSFGDTLYRVKDRNDYCQFAKQGADVVRLPM